MYKRLCKELLDVSIDGNPLAELGGLNGGDITGNSRSSNGDNRGLNFLLGGKDLGDAEQGEVEADDGKGELENDCCKKRIRFSA